MAVASPTKTATVTRTITAPAGQVYAAFTNRDRLTEWLCDNAHVNATEGGYIVLFWRPNFHSSGVYTQLEENTHVGFTWRMANETEDSQVDVQIKADGDLTEVTLTHSASETADIDSYQAEWERSLGNLVAVLETGADLRITERVILGIIPASFDADIAKTLGVPVTTGARIGNVLDGFSAAKAGFQVDDVIVAVKGKALESGYVLTDATQGSKPGDVIDVTYYRGSEKREAELELLGYPVPDIPDTFAALADSVAATRADLAKELDQLLDGVTAEEADFRPGPDEWTVHEVLAHLILTERANQEMVGSYLQGAQPTSYSGNALARLQGITAIYPSLDAIKATMKNTWAETHALLKTIPEDTAEYKASVWRIGFQLLQDPWHVQQHYRQIAENIAAARSQ